MRSPAIHRTWLVVGIALTAVVLAGTTVQVVGMVAHEEVSETATFDADGITAVFVDGDNGSVEITGEDVDEITVVAEVSHGLQRTRRSAKVVDGILELRASCPMFSQWCEVDYRISIPADLRVDVSSSNGRVIVRDTSGPVEIDGDNGRVELIRLTGNIYATTDNGRIEGVDLHSGAIVVDTDNGSIDLELTEPPTDVTATTENGSVDIQVPSTEHTYVVQLDTDNGSTDNGIRTDPTSDRSIVASTDNGDVAVRYLTG